MNGKHCGKEERLLPIEGILLSDLSKYVTSVEFSVYPSHPKQHSSDHSTALQAKYPPKTHHKTRNQKRPLNKIPVQQCVISKQSFKWHSASSFVKLQQAPYVIPSICMQLSRHTHYFYIRYCRNLSYCAPTSSGHAFYPLSWSYNITKTSAAYHVSTRVYPEIPGLRR
jgi:hypothetical protein